MLSPFLGAAQKNLCWRSPGKSFSILTLWQSWRFWHSLLIRAHPREFAVKPVFNLQSLALLAILAISSCYRISWLGVHEVKGRNQMPYQRQILLSSVPVPRPSVIFLSACAHLVALVALVLFVAFRHTAGVHIVPAKYETVQTISGTTYLSFNPAGAKAARAQVTPSLLHRSTRKARVPAGASAEGPALQALRGRARVATAGMLASIKARQFYGFSTEHYDLAAQTAGKLPAISPAELPPHFEQYVTVEVTIDVDGHVADARIVGGMAPPAIQRTLLSAIREFRYSPARRDGTPIPSQLDIVVHIPS